MCRDATTEWVCKKKASSYCQCSESPTISGIPIEFWGDCVLTVGYLINRTPYVLLDGKTPYEILYGQAPSYKHIRTFGYLCYAHDQNWDKDKFASRSLKCIFVGYPFGKKG